MKTPALVAVILLASGPAWAETFESWEDAVRGGYTLSVSQAGTEATATAEGEPAPLVRFGAGVSYLAAIRPADLAGRDAVMPEFFIGLAPWRWRVELGAELSLSRDSRFFLRPNIKLFLANGLDFSLYLQGQFALYSHPGGVELGYGGALGGSMGLLDNLALEVFAAATAFYLSPAAAESLVGRGVLGDPPTASSWVLLPSAGARLTARF